MDIFISFCVGFMTMFLILVAIGLVMFTISMVEQTKVCRAILSNNIIYNVILTILILAAIAMFVYAMIYIGQLMMGQA
jgi:hypothetical protein